MDSHKIVYFHGCFANYYDSDIGRSFVNIIDRIDTPIAFPPQVCCGLPMMAKGNLKGARENIATNENWISQVLRDESRIVTTCPSCNLFLKRYYFQGDNQEDIKNLFSDNLLHFSQYLLGLPDDILFDHLSTQSPTTVSYHESCHLRAANIGRPTLELIKRIKGVQIGHISEQCCGMGGSYGLEKTNSNLVNKLSGGISESLRSHQTDLIITDCGGCKLQIQKVSDTKVEHPVVLIDRLFEMSR